MMMNDAQANQLWQKMYKEWKAQEVPPVQIMSFIPGEHTIRRPWYNLQEKYQESYHPSPMFENLF